MDWSPVKKILATVAPTAATMLGGPLAGMAVKALSDKLLGKPDGTEEEVAAAVMGLGPQDLVRLKELDIELAKILADNDIKLEDIAAKDRADARARATAAGDWTPSIMTYILYAMLFYVIHALLQGIELKGDAQVIYMLIGALVTEVGKASNFQFGTTKGSSDKNKLLDKLANK